MPHLRINFFGYVYALAGGVLLMIEANYSTATQMVASNNFSPYNFSSHKFPKAWKHLFLISYLS